LAALHTAKRQLASARRALARATTPDDPYLLVEPRWRWAADLVAARLEALRRLPGVVGVGLGCKFKGGVDTGTPCITVFVKHKHRPEALARRGLKPLPKVLRAKGRALPIDVVQVGTMKRQAFAGQSCSVTSDVTRSGTIGAPAVDLATGATVFITAMHVTGRSELGAGNTTNIPVRVPSTQDSPGAAIIGRVLQGSRRGIDAAKVSVEGANVVLRELPDVSVKSIKGWRPVAFPGDQGTSVVAFGSRSKTLHRGQIVHPAMFMPGFNLEAAIVVRGMATVNGDSGAALLDGQSLVLGFLVGATSDGFRIFSPAGLVFKRLGCDIPTV
jgi:hypothetical protein